MVGAGESGPEVSRSPQLQAPVERCPFLPAAVVAMHGDTLALSAAQSIFAECVAHPAVVAQTECKLRIARSRSRQKRGPPALSSL